MLIFLYGADSYRRQKRLNKILGEYRNKYSNLSCDYFDLEDAGELSRLKEFAAQMLIFDNKKLAVLRGVYEADKKGIKEFLKRHQGSKDFTILISEEKRPPAEFKPLLKKSFSMEEFKKLEGDVWYLFMQKEMRERNLSLTLAVINFLAEVFKGDTWGLVNELDKLSLLPRDLILDLEKLKKIGSYPYQSPNIFTFINMVIGGRLPSEKITALEKLFIGQEEPVKIFNILASLKRLPDKLIRKLADYDIMVKSGKLDYEEVLLDLAI